MSPFLAAVSITLALWACVGMLAYAIVRTGRYVWRRSGFRRFALWSAFLALYYIFLPHLAASGIAQLVPDFNACSDYNVGDYGPVGELSDACGQLMLAGLFFLGPVFVIPMNVARERFGWFGGQVATLEHDDEPEYEDRVYDRNEGMLEREKKPKKYCPVCKRYTRCRIRKAVGLSMAARRTVWVHVIRDH